MKRRVVLATGNPGKLREFRQMLGALAIEIVPQTELGVPPVAETGLSFVENAILKARHAAAYTGLPALADDSGLEVDALHGAPGIYSARYAGPQASDEENLRKLIADLAGVPEEKRTARFQCLLVYMRDARDPTPVIAQGTWEGRILAAPQGAHGFGYDPVFYVPRHACSAAQLPPEVKNAISHRAQALAQLLETLRAGHLGYED